jgi:hypothetical protein
MTTRKGKGSAILMSTAPLASNPTVKEQESRKAARARAERHADNMELRRQYKAKKRKRKVAAKKAAATRARNSGKRTRTSVDAMRFRAPGSGWTRFK